MEVDTWTRWIGYDPILSKTYTRGVRFYDKCGLNLSLKITQFYVFNKCPQLSYAP
jgi:hypothetical protein